MTEKLCISSAANHLSDAHQISAAFTLGNGPDETPCHHYILPMTRTIPSVRCAVAATAAGHLGNRLQDDQLHKQSLHLRLKSTELLRAELETGSHVPDLARLLCMLLLAQLDVCVTCPCRRCLSDRRGRSALETVLSLQYTSKLRVHLSDSVNLKTGSEVLLNSVWLGNYCLRFVGLDTYHRAGSMLWMRPRH